MVAVGGVTYWPSPVTGIVPCASTGAFVQFAVAQVPSGPTGTGPSSFQLMLPGCPVVPDTSITSVIVVPVMTEAEDTLEDSDGGLKSAVSAEVPAELVAVAAKELPLSWSE